MASGKSIYDRLRAALPAVARLPEECWIVGGGVRDALMDRDPKDVDCAVVDAAAAAETFAARTGGRKVCLAREPLETWRVVLNGLDWDFTEFGSGTLESDLGRRDFTIGALAVSVRPPHEIRDPFGGLADIDRRLVRMVAETNLSEDPLRMLRAVRLAGTLEFDIEPETRSFIAVNARLLRESAAERVTAEVDEIVTTRDVSRSLQLLVDLKLDREVFEEGLDSEAMKRCAGVFSPDVVPRYAAIFFGREDQLRAHAEASRWSADRRKNVVAAIEFARAATERWDDAELSILVHEYGTRAARRAAELLAALGATETANRLSQIVRTNGASLENMRPLIDGGAIRTILGIEDGPEIGRLRRILLEAQIRGTVRTQGEAEELVRQEHVRVPS